MSEQKTYFLKASTAIELTAEAGSVSACRDHRELVVITEMDKCYVQWMNNDCASGEWRVTGSSFSQQLV